MKRIFWPLFSLAVAAGAYQLYESYDYRDSSSSLPERPMYPGGIKKSRLSPQTDSENGSGIHHDDSGSRPARNEAGTEAAQPPQPPAAPERAPAPNEASQVQARATKQQNGSANAERSGKNPYDASRWRRDLSGAKAHMRMTAKDTAGDCGASCEQPAPRELSLAGVVWKKKADGALPKAVLKGSVERGHYRNQTPAVYVE